jgi:hypothetical protein
VQKGWIRALKGHVVDLSTLVFKGDDPLKISFFAETISKSWWPLTYLKPIGLRMGRYEQPA